MLAFFTNLLFLVEFVIRFCSLILSYLTNRQLFVVLNGRSLQVLYLFWGSSRRCSCSAGVFLLNINDPPTPSFKNLNLSFQTLWIVAGNVMLISMLGKLNLCHLIAQITLLLMLKWMSLPSMNRHLLRSCDCLFFINRIGAIIFSLLLLVSLKKLEF